MFNEHLEKVKIRQDLFELSRQSLVKKLKTDVEDLEALFETSLKVLTDKNNQDSLDETVVFLAILDSASNPKKEEEKVAPKSSKKIL